MYRYMIAKTYYETTDIYNGYVRKSQCSPDSQGGER